MPRILNERTIWQALRSAAINDNYDDAVQFIREADYEILRWNSYSFVRHACAYRQLPLLTAVLDRIGFHASYAVLFTNYHWQEGLDLLARYEAGDQIIRQDNDRSNDINELSPIASPPGSLLASAELPEFDARSNTASPPLVEPPSSFGLPLAQDDNNVPPQENPDQFEEPPQEREPIRPREFLTAVMNDNLQDVQAYIDQYGNNRVAMNFTERSSGNNALLFAAMTGNNDIINALLDTGKFDLSYRNSAGHNVVQIAAMNNHLDLAARLQALVDDLEQRAAASQSQNVGEHSAAAPSGTFAERLERIGVDDTNIPRFFKCPFSNDIMTDPVVIRGETFDRSSLVDLFSNPDTYQGRSPYGNIISRVDFELAVVCTAFKDAIESYVMNLEKQHQPKSAAQAVGDSYQQQMKALKQSSNDDDDSPQPDAASSQSSNSN